MIGLVSACGSKPTSTTAPPADPPPVVVVALADAGVDAPEPPKLVCANGTTPTPAPAPEPTWFCARPDGTRHGPFVTLFPDHAIAISGTYAAGALDGAWQRHDAATGAIVERGSYAGGRKHGTWTVSNARGTTLGEYEMVDGTGVEKRWRDDGALYDEAAYKAGVLDGPSKVYAKDGAAVIAARYKSGKLDGPHAFGSRNTMRFEDTFADGILRGGRKIWHHGALLADETYDRRGRLDGPYASWRSTKIARVKGRFASGHRVGAWVWNDRDGKKEREGSYVNGKRDGEWLEWVDDKLAFSGTYNVGRPNGTFTYYARSGIELGHFDIADGTGWMLTFHAPGKPSSKQHLYKGVPDGGYQELTRTGALVTEGHYANGVKHGIWKEWTPSGVPVLEQNWKRGMLDGIVKKFVDGKLSMQATFVDGKAEGAYVEYRLDRPSLTGQFADDRRTGPWTQYAPDGAVVLTATYKAGVLDGTWRELTEGVVLEGSMVAGRRSGTWTRIDKLGNVRKLPYRTP